jgi:hypothetical protein
MTTPDDFDIFQRIGYQDAEFNAWATVVAEWRAAGLPDMDREFVAPVIKAIEVWAENLVGLRSTQTAKERAQAMLDKHESYQRVATMQDETK